MLQKQEIDINFAGGLDTKTDKNRVSPGKFLSLTNSVFDTIGQLTKRNGFAALTQLDNAMTNILTTFSGGLIAVGDSLQSLGAQTGAWTDKGYINQVSLSTVPAIRSNTSQIQCDMAISPANVSCVVSTALVPNSNGTTTNSYTYTLVDITSGETLVAPTPIHVTTGTIVQSPKVRYLNGYFVIVFVNNISGTYHLQYVRVNAMTFVASNQVDIASTVSNPTGTNPKFDLSTANNAIYIAWDASDGGGAIRICYITSFFVISAPKVIAGHSASVITIAADPVNSSVFVAWWTSSGGALIYTAAFDYNLNQLLAPTFFISQGGVTNITALAGVGDTNTVFNCEVVVEIGDVYGYDNSIPSHSLLSFTVNANGGGFTQTTFGKSLGIASKPFVIAGVIYMLATYQSAFQSTYFLIDMTGNIVGKLAYSNGGGYLVNGIPQSLVVDNVFTSNLVYIPYLFADQVTSVNKSQGAVNTSGIYSQSGVNIANWNFEYKYNQSTEIAGNLNFTGGIVWEYDGNKPVEQGFNVWPDNVEVAGNNSQAALVYTGNLNSTTIITSLSSTVNLVVGMHITGTNIPANTFVTSITGSQMTISNAATGTASGVSLTFTGAISNQQYFYVATYEWTDNAGNIHRSAPSLPVSVTTSASGLFNVINIPTLRLTYKNNVRIVIYRWSTGQPVYYQVQPVTQPLLNDITVNSLSYVDIYSDSQILGNTILYTTGGVLENIGPPASSIIALYGSRFFMVDAEDNNLVWYSKLIVESTPVEMSDQQTMYIAPTLASETATGPITALFPMDDKLVIFKTNAIYYVNGVGPDATGNNNQYSEPVFITATVGCNNPNSIVMSPNGLMFKSNKGIWLLGRDLNTNYIGAAVEEFNSNSVQNAINVPGTNQIRFTLDNNTALMYDYYVGQWGVFNNTTAVSSTLYKGLHTYVNNSGLVLQETPGLYIDYTKPVLMSFTTGWMSLAGVQGYERFYFAHLLGEYITPFKLQVGFAYNNNSPVVNTVNVTPDPPGPLYGFDPFYGSSTPYGGPSTSFKARIFPSIQKCESFQVSVNELYDPSYGIAPGAGLTLTGMLLTIGAKRGYRTQSAARSFG